MVHLLLENEGSAAHTCFHWLQPNSLTWLVIESDLTVYESPTHVPITGPCESHDVSQPPMARAMYIHSELYTVQPSVTLLPHTCVTWPSRQAM